GHRVTWFTSYFEQVVRRESIAGIEFIRRGNFITVYFLAFFFYIFSGKKFDVVIDEIHGIPFFTPFYVRVPKIAFIHEVAEEIWDYMYPFPVNKIGKFFESFYFLFYKHVLFWTDAPSAIDDLVRLGITRSHCKAIACPIQNEVKTTLPKKEKDFTSIFVSRVVRMKGIEEVIKAFGFIHKENKQAKLWIVGGGEKGYVQKLHKMLYAYGITDSVKFFGKVTNQQKLSLMARAHVLLHASVKEGWGLVVIEAASQATPSVVYSVTGLKDSVKNGKTGMVLLNNSPQEMAKEALSMFYNKKLYTIFQRNCLTWANTLSWNTAVSESLALLHKSQRNYEKNYF
ncbi:MAG: glycosyltransferase family 4 protein, partial [Candidatus Levyibacteriota bacterium]